MSEFAGPLISKPNGRLGRRSPSTDAIFGLVAGGVLPGGTSTYTDFGQIVKLIEPDAAVALGINAAYDANNAVLVYHHISRFFAYNPNATLYLMLVPQDTTLAEICDKDNDYLRKLLADEQTNGEVRVAGVVLNPSAAPASGDYTTGLLTDVLDAIPVAQALVDQLASEAHYVDNVMLEGLLSSAATAATLPNLRALAEPAANVSVCIAADGGITDSTTGPGLRYAAIGAALGMLSVRKVSECLGSVDVARKPDAYKGRDTYPLTNARAGYFLSAALSNGVSYNDLTTPDKTALGNKGYIYAGRFVGMDGVYFNDSHTCTPASDDYAYIEDNRVWNKATRLLRRALLPLFRGEVEVDVLTGFLTASQVAYYQVKGVAGVRQMAADGELADTPTLLIDASQDVIATATVSMELAYVRRGILRVIKAVIGAVNPAAN